MKRILSNGEEGLEGLPLQLIIVVLIITATVVPSLIMFEAYDQNNKEARVLNEIEFLIVRVQQVYLGGVGNSQSMEIDLSGGVFTNVERVEIGDQPGGLWMTIRYKLNERSEKLVSVKSPVVPMGAEEAGQIRPLILASGTHQLRLIGRDDHDFNQDGINDLFVEIRRE